MCMDNAGGFNVEKKGYCLYEKQASSIIFHTKHNWQNMRHQTIKQAIKSYLDAKMKGGGNTIHFALSLGFSRMVRDH